MSTLCFQLFEISYSLNNLVSCATTIRIPKGHIAVWASPYSLEFFALQSARPGKLQQVVLMCTVCVSL